MQSESFTLRTPTWVEDRAPSRSGAVHASGHSVSARRCVRSHWNDALSQLLHGDTYNVGDTYDLRGLTDGRSAADRADLNPSVDCSGADALPAR